MAKGFMSVIETLLFFTTSMDVVKRVLGAISTDGGSSCVVEISAEGGRAVVAERADFGAITGDDGCIRGMVVDLLALEMEDEIRLTEGRSRVIVTRLHDDEWEIRHERPPGVHSALREAFEAAAAADQVVFEAGGG